MNVLGHDRSHRLIENRRTKLVQCAYDVSLGGNSFHRAPIARYHDSTDLPSGYFTDKFTHPRVRRERHDQRTLGIE